MVSVGTLLTVGIVAAVGIASYAIYNNLGKVGAVVTAGVTKSVSNPFGDWLDSVIGGSQNGAGSGGGGGSGGALPGLPVATAQLPTGDVGITESQAASIENKYAKQAQINAQLILKSFAPGAQKQLITAATLLAEQSATPITTQAYSIIDAARVSVGGEDPLLNKFYRLFTLANKPYGALAVQGKILPLSRSAVQAFAKVGVIAREVYL